MNRDKYFEFNGDWERVRRVSDVLSHLMYRDVKNEVVIVPHTEVPMGSDEDFLPLVRPELPDPSHVVDL